MKRRTAFGYQVVLCDPTNPGYSATLCAQRQADRAAADTAETFRMAGISIGAIVGGLAALYIIAKVIKKA